MDKGTHEDLVNRLKDPEVLKSYMADCDGYKPSLAARALGRMLVASGNLMYGTKPSYEKFKAIEVIARIPYQSWESVAYTLLTRFYTDEERAIRLLKVLPFARHAHDNETMHVVVISQIAKKQGNLHFMQHTLTPLLFSFFYYWIIWLLSFFDRKVAFELNYMFEQHAFDQYTEFVNEHAEVLRSLPLESHFLKVYGREAKNEYEFFNTVRLDEVIHRNCSLVMVRELALGRVM